MTDSQEQAKAALAALLAALEPLGVTTVHVEYSGSGDEGDIDLVECRAADGSVVDVADALFDEVHEACRSLLYAVLGVWYDNDGGAGRMRIDVATADVDLDHGWYETVLQDDPHTFNLLTTGPRGE